MDVRIGVIHIGKELALEVAGTADDIERALAAALGDEQILWLTDVKGRRVGVPADRVAYVEIDTDGAAKQVGFGRA